jgi:hypothetical protein
MWNLSVCSAFVLSLGLDLSVARAGESPKAEAAQTAIRLRVRVEDRLGRPVSKARGTLFKTTPPSKKAARSNSPLVITKEGAAPVSKTDGVVETAALPIKTAYVLEIDADGFAPELSLWTHPQQFGTIDLPPVKLRRLCSIKGTVVNRQGKPIPNVTVIQSGDGPKRLEAVTDGQGRFVLNGVPEGKIVVCFEATGYRFYGSVLSCPAENARIELEQTGDPNPRTLKREPLSSYEWPQERRSAAAKTLLEPIIAAVLAKNLINEADQGTLQAAAQLEPARILARINALKFVRPYGQQQVRNSAAYALMDRGKPDAALEAVSKFPDPQSQLVAYLYWFRNSGAKKNPVAHRIALTKARGMIAAIKEPAERVFRLCEVATQLWDLGEHAAAREVFCECQTLLEGMPADGRDQYGNRTNLAVALARDNVGQAKKLAADLEPGQMIRLAAEIARHRPKEVEPFLANVPSELSLIELHAVANNLPQLCYRVARHDPAAAERILIKFARPPQAQSAAESVFGLAGGLFGNLSQELIEFEVLKIKAACYGLIADAAAKHDPPAARRALVKGVELLRPLRTGFVHPATQFYHSPAVLMAMLIPVAERVDPALANEIFWRALSLRIAMSGENYERQMLDTDTPELVDIVKFYDEPLAVDLLEPVLSRTRSRSYSGMPTYIWAIRSMALLDSERAVLFPNSLSDLPDWDGSLPRVSATRFVASLLANSSLWDKDVSRRLRNELASVRNVYDAYVSEDDDGD